LDFPTTTGAWRTSFTGGSFNDFILKLNPSGSALVYSTFIGNFGAFALTIDSTGNAYVAGSANPSNLYTSPGAYRSTVGDMNACPNTNTASYVMKMNPTGTAPVWATYAGECQRALGIALDSSNNVYITGETE